MEFGINKQYKLLTIAIPTFNRSETLDIALSHLAPQILKLNHLIELITYTI